MTTTLLTTDSTFPSTNLDDMLSKPTNTAAPTTPQLHVKNHAQGLLAGHNSQVLSMFNLADGSIYASADHSIVINGPIFGAETPPSSALAGQLNAALAMLVLVVVVWGMLEVKRGIEDAFSRIDVVEI